MTTPPKGSGPGPVSLEALFLGPQSENQEFFRSMLEFLIEEHVHWRRDFHPKDHPLLTPKEMRAPEFLATADRMREVLLDLSARLKSTSTPWFSTRYLGHMNSDTLMVSNLAQMAALLYNPNNVTYESSMATSPMEIECGQDFARLMGYDPRTAWGHITSDGTIANYEGLWLARNLKSFPAAAAEIAPELVEDRDPWALANLSIDRSLDLLDVAKRSNQLAEILRRSARGAGAGWFPLGKLLVSSTRHYSWEKAADLLGIGVEQVVRIPVTDRFRMDLNEFQEAVDRLVREKTPILGVVGVVGTTEEGAVDEIDGLVRLRDQYARRGIGFYLHVDAAYGGYGRALFLDSRGTFLPYERLRDAWGKGTERPGPESAVPSREVWAAYRAMSAADSITVDPHKMGYVPYSAGGIAIRDRRLLGLVSYSAAYVFDRDNPLDLNLGSVILEGSKAGATAAGVWAAHRVLPLNRDGYGRIIARTIEGTDHFIRTLRSMREFSAGGERIVCEPLLANPDYNIVCMAFNFKGNPSLARMNRLNEAIYHASSYESGPLYNDKWITSHTELERTIYGDAPRPFLDRLGIDPEEWARVGTVYVLRSVVMHPWLAHTSTYPEKWESYLSIMKGDIDTIVRGSKEVRPPRAGSAPGRRKG